MYHSLSMDVHSSHVAAHLVSSLSCVTSTLLPLLEPSISDRQQAALAVPHHVVLWASFLSALCHGQVPAGQEGDLVCVANTVLPQWCS